MYRNVFLLLALAISLNGFCQHKGEIVATIGDKKILKDEFVRLYKKNNQSLFDNSEKKTPEEYINLFINYQLKVYEAEDMGMDTLSTFVNELQSYRKELARPYLTDVHFTEQMVNEAYQRTINEVKASHILLRLNEDALPKDTLAQYNKIMKIREQVQNGKNFEELAFQFSDDPSAKKNKGVLGYFNAFQMVFPFEQAAYKTPVGEISMPVRTRFGYHLIHIMDKRLSTGQIKVAHIMKRVPTNASEESVNRAKSQLDSIAELIKSGKDFAQLAKQFSDDRRSANRGGEMDWFSSSGLMPEFTEPSFALQKNGDVSSVIRTPYGWHIIKRIDRKPIPSFEEIEQQLIDKIKKNPAISKHSKKLFINKLKAAYNFKVNNEAVDSFIKLIVAQTDNKKLKKPATESLEQVLCSFAGQEIRGKDFWNHLLAVNLDNKNPESFLAHQFQDFVEKQLIGYEDLHLEEKYPDFKYLMKEYHDGILLFNISEQKIWSAASSDSIGLEAFYKKNPSKFLWEERFKGWVIKCPNQEIKDFTDEILSADNQLTVEEFSDQVRQHFNMDIDVEKGAFEKGNNPLVDYFVWGGLKPESFQEGLHFIRGNKIAPETKSLNEARGLYISEYQKTLEEQWIKALRKKYKVKINKKVIKSVNPV